MLNTVYYVGADSDGGTVEKYSVNGQVKTIKSKYDDDNEISIENDGIAVSKTLTNSEELFPLKHPEAKVKAYSLPTTNMQTVKLRTLPQIS